VAMDEAEADGVWVWYGTEGVTVQNNIITEAGLSGVALTYDSTTDVVTDATVTGNEITDCVNGIDVGGCLKDSMISDNTITGCASYNDGGRGINFAGGFLATETGKGGPTEGNTITGNTITDNLSMGICLKVNTCALGTEVFDDNVIEGNIISGNAEGGIVIKDSLTIAGLEILNNDITDNEDVGFLIESWNATNAIKFNTITGNDADNDGYGIENASAADVVDATFNWWGTDVADDVADMVSDDVTYEPFLAGTADTVFSASEIAVGATSLDAKTDVGVRVSVADAAGDATAADVISVAKYAANPQAAISDAIAFYDVYVVTATPDVDVTIKFYAGDENSTLEVWSVENEVWVERTDADYSVYGGYVYVTVLADLLDGTPFVVVAGEAEADELDTPEIAAPASGADDVSLTPTFAWGAVDDADGYFFELADNANFVLPLVKLDGDVGRLIVTAYAYVGELPYSTAYYWRVKAVSGTVEFGDLLESDWVSAVFITKPEPEEPIPPVVVEEAPVLPDITITQPDIIVQSPDVIVPLPAVVETPITPSWIYVIIGVGAALVIALLVLIVRTRRVA